MTALASRYLNVAKNIVTAAGVTYDLVHLETSNPIKRLSKLRNTKAAT